MSNSTNPEQSDNIAHGSRSDTHQQKSARLHYVLENLGLFFEAAAEQDPLPLLRELTADLLDARDIHIAIPAGTGSGSPLDDRVHTLVQSIAIKGRPIGRLVARRSTPFSSEDRALGFMIGQLIGVVLEQSTLQGQVEQYHQESQANADTLEQLIKLKRQIVSGRLSPQEVVLLLTTHVQTMVGAERASLLIVSEEQPEAPQLVLSNGTFASCARAREVRDHGLAGLVLREHRSLIIDETGTDQRWMSIALESHDAPSRCAMAVPLIWGEQVLGVLTVTTTRSHAFGPLHLNLLELIGYNVALALRSASLNMRIKRLAAMLMDVTANLNTPLHKFQQLASNLAGTSDPLLSEHDLEAVLSSLEHLQSIQQQMQVACHELRIVQRVISQDGPSPAACCETG